MNLQGFFRKNVGNSVTGLLKISSDKVRLSIWNSICSYILLFVQFISLCLKWNCKNNVKITMNMQNYKVVMSLSSKNEIQMLYADIKHFLSLFLYKKVWLIICLCFFFVYTISICICLYMNMVFDIFLFISSFCDFSMLLCHIISPNFLSNCWYHTHNFRLSSNTASQRCVFIRFCPL